MSKLKTTVNRLFGNAGPLGADMGSIWGDSSYDSSTGPSGKALNEAAKSSEGLPQNLTNKDSDILHNDKMQVPASAGIPSGITSEGPALQKQLDALIGKMNIKGMARGQLSQGQI